MAVLGLRCCVQASHWDGFSCCKARAPGTQASVAVARGLQSAGSAAVAHGLSCSAACGILPDQGSNPCPLHWQADSQPLCHQGSPLYIYLLLLLGWVFVAARGLSPVAASGLYTDWLMENVVTRGSQESNTIFSLGAKIQYSLIQCLQQLYRT